MENIYLPKELFTESEQKIDGNTIKRCLSEQIGAYETDCLIYAIAKKNPEERVVELPLNTMPRNDRQFHTANLLICLQKQLFLPI